MTNISILLHDHGSCATIIGAWPYGYRDLSLMFGLRFNGCLVIDASMLDWWLLMTDIISSVGYLRLDSLELVVMDGMWQHSGISIVLQVLWNNINSTKNSLRAWIDHIEESYIWIILSTYIYICMIYHSKIYVACDCYHATILLNKLIYFFLTA